MQMFRPIPGRFRESAYASLLAAALTLSCSKTDPPSGRGPASSRGPAPVRAFLDGFSGQGFVLKDSVRGDLNRDSLSDLLLVFTNAAAPVSGEADSVEPRLLAGLLGTAGGNYALAFANRQAMLCRTCGGGLNDPYLGTVIKDGFFSLEQSGSTSDMDWKRITTFRYIDSLKTWLLHKDGMVSRPVASDPGREGEPGSLTVIKTRKDFGNVPIDSFDIYALDERYPDLESRRIFPVSFGQSQGYMGWHLVKGGIWRVLDLCTDRISRRYLFFLKSHGEPVESASESDLSVTYELVLNGPESGDCRGYAFKDIPGIVRGQVRRALFDSAMDAYHLGTDTIFHSIVPDSADANIEHHIYRRGPDAVIAKETFNSAAGSIVPSLIYCGDLNGDGFLDLIIESQGSPAQTSLSLSKAEPGGKVSMEMAAWVAFTD